MARKKSILIHGVPQWLRDALWQLQAKETGGKPGQKNAWMLLKLREIVAGSKEENDE